VAFFGRRESPTKASAGSFVTLVARGGTNEALRGGSIPMVGTQTSLIFLFQAAAIWG
jgi:hypothetical protein